MGFNVFLWRIIPGHDSDLLIESICRVHSSVGGVEDLRTGDRLFETLLDQCLFFSED